MQLGSPAPSSIRGPLGAAACVLLAAGLPGAALADDATTPAWQFEGSGLVYAEQGRTVIAEPLARVTHFFRNGQSLAGQFTLDAMTGASPSGAMASSTVQTTTSPSGNVTTTPIGQIPTQPFRDTRGAAELEWKAPVGTLLNLTATTAYSREKDYQSVGGSAGFALDVFHRLVTITASAGSNRDQVSPVNGTPIGLSDGVVRLSGSNDKRVTSGSVGISRILTRRWMVGVEGSRIVERGYLTEPYKVMSLVDPEDGGEVGTVTENRPGNRQRTSVLGSSVYHPGPDVLYTTYRYYWDDWGVRSHTIDLRFRHDIEDRGFWQPHLRLYAQSQADFFHFSLVDGEPLPAYGSSDQRLGPLRSVTLGLTYGFRLPNQPGEFTVRGEWIHQWGDGFPATAIGDQTTYSLFPPLEIGTLHVGYTVQF